MNVLQIIGDVLVVIGGLIFLSAALGIMRFPDAYTRISAVGTAGGLGITFVVVGAVMHSPSLADTVKVILIVVLQLTTSAIGTIAIARSAYLTRVPLARRKYDELATAEEEPTTGHE
ncbi:cation:proton antiporter [Microbacterium amylolyticum]|uniref:Multicomponent Na+:H+ antiporter subunit G n=1 Tax=Microbacterium amylolyticum TaxID=936337 RepID=A0ABS4ZK74_9MICO|nr:monovalent cation/H(+) antiporter subunit G [Microbacterium amylolyticum]MBP2437692.1 multicomponent Na+:H+ antiporter subunit G [Microbacterium amylolyticum]